MTESKENKIINQYYPLKSVTEHKMKGYLLAKVTRGEFEDEPMLTLVNGESYSWYDYQEDRGNWEQDGFPGSDGELYDFPESLRYNRCRALPIPDFDDLDDADENTYFWEQAQNRLLRSQQPLVIKLTGSDSLELDDWATNQDLVLLVKNRYSEDPRFQDFFRLMMEIRCADDEQETELRDISQLNFTNWSTVLNGTMPLVVSLEYLNKEESAERKRQHERALQPLIINTPHEKGKYTMENWAEKPFKPWHDIHLEGQLQEKYPELARYSIKLLIVLPGEEEPKDIGTMTQQTQQHILEADTPLEVSIDLF